MGSAHRPATWIFAAAAALAVISPLAGDEIPWEVRNLDPVAAEKEYLRAPDLVQSLEPRKLGLGGADEVLGVVRLLRDGNLEGAEAAARHLVTERPGSYAGRECLGMCLASRGELDGSRKVFREALDRFPELPGPHTALGCIDLAEGKKEKARTHFLAALERDPADRRAHQRLGLIYEEEGKSDEAIEHFEKGLVGTPPGYVGIKVNLARLWNRRGLFEKSLALLEPVVPLSSENRAAHLSIGLARLALGRAEPAVEAFRRAVELRPEEPAGRVLLASALRQAGRARQGLGVLEKVLADRPDWSVALFQIGEAHRELREWEAAFGAYSKAAEASEKPGLARLRMAQVLIAQKRYEDAEKRLVAISRSGDAFLEADAALASLLQNTGRLDQARAAYEALVGRYPERAEAHYLAGVFLAYARDYAGATSRLERSLELSPRDPRALKALALSLARQGERARALAAARRLAALEPTLANRFFLATTCEDAGRRDEAARIYREVLAEKPDHAIALNNLALIEAGADEDRLEDALAMAQKAVSLLPENGSVRDTHGWILYRAGEIARSVAELKKALALSARNPSIAYHLALALGRSGDTAGARATIEKALGLAEEFPERADAEQLLAFLKKGQG